MSNRHILLVDDDQELSELLRDYLQGAGLTVTLAHNAAAARALITQRVPFDLAIFDIMMPGQSGLELLQQLRPAWNVPVIMLTGRGADIDRILGLEMGADDYLAKPCHPRELLARIHAVLRRSGEPAPVHPDGQVLSIQGVELYPARCEVLARGQPVELTGAEFNVLFQLMSHPGQVISKAQLTERVLHRPLTAYDRAIDVHISRVRQKLAPFLGGDELIKTLRGSGYLCLGDR